MADAQARFERYVAGLSDEDALLLNRIASRRAAYIYEPMYREKREATWKAGMAASTLVRRAQPATPSRV